MSRVYYLINWSRHEFRAFSSDDLLLNIIAETKVKAGWVNTDNIVVDSEVHPDKLDVWNELLNRDFTRVIQE